MYTPNTESEFYKGPLKLKEGTYIPETNFVYPDNPTDIFLHPTKKHDINFDETYPFYNTSLPMLLWKGFVHGVLLLLIRPLSYVAFGLKIEGRENIRNNRKALKKGCMSVSNHVYPWDLLAVKCAFNHRPLYFPTKTTQIESGAGIFIRGAGGIPIPGSIKAIRYFNEAFDKVNAKHKVIHVFPEASRWDYYQPIRPWHKGTFTMAYKYNLPVIPMAFSYRPVTGLWKLWKKNPCVTLRIGEPVFPDMEKGRKEACAELFEKARAQVIDLAGIEENCWIDETV